MSDQTQKDAPQVKEASRVVTLDDIKFNEANKVMAILSCIPIVGVVMFFVEKKDLYVRYYAAMFGAFMIVPVVTFIIGLIPVINIIMFCLSPIVMIATIVLIVMGMIKASKGEKLVVPGLSDIALKLMNAIQ